MKSLRAIAIHLPQFHPFPENDAWWGKGFTEWTNVTKAQPRFPGHYQPHLPADLGFYDLRLEQSRLDQAALAASYGIHGFCYYHYWFNGKRLMQEPLDAMLASGKPDFPFMYCWANENWSRRWDGAEENVLIQQHYSSADDIDHIRFLCTKVFSDKRYIRVQGKPFFAVYRPQLFPDIAETLRTWRREAAALGMELYIGYMQSFNYREDPAIAGFDTAIAFEPDFYTKLPALQPGLAEKLKQKISGHPSPLAANRVIDYEQYTRSQQQLPAPPYRRFPGVTPMWDNTARRKQGAFILHGSTPERYGEWLRQTAENFDPPSAEENFIFINAWNEWAEGNHLEPCQRWGTQYLEATKKVMEQYGQ